MEGGLLVSEISNFWGGFFNEGGGIINSRYNMVSEDRLVDLVLKIARATHPSELLTNRLGDFPFFDPNLKMIDFKSVRDPGRDLNQFDEKLSSSAAWKAKG